MKVSTASFSMKHSFLWIAAGLAGLFIIFGPNTLFSQCNPESAGPFGNPYQTGDGRYEIEITPETNLNLMGVQFCTGDQQDGMACCTPPPSKRCVDIIFKVLDPAGGGVFSDICSGAMTVMTAQGNFEEAFLSINGSDPMGGNVDCSAGIDIGNNNTIKASFAGKANGDVDITLEIFDKNDVLLGSLSNTITPSATPHYAIVTICKPGFGCVEDEFVFGCCNVAASIALNAGSPSEICFGESTTLKFTADQGTPPYTVAYLVDDGMTMTNQQIVVGTNGGPVMDMATLMVSPTKTTTYTILSVEDATGCAQPPGANDQVTVTVNPLPTVYTVTGGGPYCAGGTGVPVGLDGSQIGVLYQLKRNGSDVGGPLGGTGAALNFGNQTIAGTYTVLATNATTTCSATMQGTAVVSINPLPIMGCPSDLTVCLSDLPLTLTNLGATPVGGVFSGSGVAANMYSAAGGTTNVVTYTVTDLNGCSNSCTFSITVVSNPVVTCPADLTVCLDDSPFVLANGAPGGGTHSGPGVSGGNTFNPANAGKGTHTITYTVTDAFNCSGTCTYSIQVVEVKIYDVVGGGSYCKDGAGVPVGLSDSELNVNYQLKHDGSNVGAPVAGTGFGLNFGLQTVAGTYTVEATSTLNATCKKNMNGSAVVTITDLIMSDVITHSPNFCMKDPGPIIGMSGSKVGVNYQLQTAGGMSLGAPVAGTGNPFYFGTYPNGNYKVVATDGMGCTATTTATVNATPDVCEIDAPDICTCDAPGGYTPVTIKINAPAGQNWEVKAVIGLYGANPYPQIAVGTPLTDIGGNMHTLNAYRSNVNGFFIVVTNGYTDLNIAVGIPSW